MKDDEHALSTEGPGTCEACGQQRLVRLYMLQNCEAAFVCKPCRTGKEE